MKRNVIVKFLDDPLVAGLLTIAGMIVIVEIVSSLSPRWAPVIFMCVGAGGAISVIFGNGIKHKIKEVRNCI